MTRSLGQKQFVQIGEKRYQWPLASLIALMLKRKGIDPNTLEPFDTEDFETLWDLKEPAPYVGSDNHLVGLLEDTKSKQFIAYAYGAVEYDEDTPTVKISFVSTHPNPMFRGQGYCSLLMRNVFAQIRAKFPKSNIELFNIAEGVGLKCYEGSARENGYKLECLDTDREKPCQDMRFQPL